MGFDFEGRKSFVYGDLLKLEETRDRSSVAMSSQQWRSPGSSNSCDSSSSGFDSPFGSEMDSSESEDGDFTAELSRQMAECMLHEEEEEEEEEERKPVITRSVPLRSFEYGPNSYSNRPVLDHANQVPCIKMKSQPPIGVSRGRRVNGAELTQQWQTRKTEQNYGRYREREWKNGSGRTGQNRSGMQAVFLGGAGLRIGSTGTGVFLPRVANNDPVEPKKKSALSTVLIPTRVLEALELHFTRQSDSEGSPVRSSRYASPRDERVRSKWQENIHARKEMEEANRIDEIQILPQEWTY